MSEPRSEDRIRFLQNLRDGLLGAERSNKPALMFVRCVERNLQENAAVAIEEAFTRIAWTRLDLRQDASWVQIQQASQRRQAPKTAQGLLLHSFPVRDDGEVDRRAVQELRRLAPFFLRKGTISLFVIVAGEAQAVMEDAEELWTSRAGYYAWPQRSQPLTGRNPYGEEESEVDPSTAPPPTRRPGRPAAAGLEGASGANLLLAAATLYQNGYIDHAGGHAVQALTGFEAMHDHRGAGEAQHLLAMIAEKRHDVSSGLAWYEKALESYRRVKGTELEQAIVLERMGHLHYGRGQFELALTQLRRALELDEARADERRMAGGFRHLALVLERVDQLPLADTFLRKSLEIEQRMENRAGLARCYVHLGRVGYRLGRFMEANDHLTQALGICEDLDDRSGMSAVLHELGNADLEQGLQPEAIKWYKKALKVDEERGDRRALARVNAQLGHAFAEAGRAEDALRHLLTAHQAAHFLGVSVAKQVIARIHQLRDKLDKDLYQVVVEEVAERARVLEKEIAERAAAPPKETEKVGPPPDDLVADFDGHAAPEELMPDAAAAVGPPPGQPPDSGPTVSGPPRFDDLIFDLED